MSAVTINIAGVDVGIDAQGRYSLNDLHRAAGGEDRHKPGNWQQNQQTKDLIAEIQIAGIPAIQSKQGLGTFACRELIYAYAMWISPSFHLKVIRAYDALATGNLQTVVPQTLPEALRLAADLADQKDRAEAALAIAAPKAAALDLISAGDDDVTISQAAKILGVRRDRLTNWMHTERWVFRQNESWVAYQPQINNGRLRYKEAKYTDENTGQQCVKPYCHITPKGLAKLAVVFGEARVAA